MHGNPTPAGKLFFSPFLHKTIFCSVPVVLSEKEGITTHANAMLLTH
jgi:hypothetical protein